MAGRVSASHTEEAMAIQIGLFNHKGGVSKTTTTFNLGWMLAEKGYRVIVVDSDPQCNLTGIVLGYRGPTELERFFTEERGRNLMSGLAPAFESQPRSIEAVQCVEVPGRDGLFLLPGHIRLSEYEVTLGIAQELSGSLQTLQNLPGSFSFLLKKTAELHNADYVLVDMSPSLSSINQNLLMTSDYFIVPSAPDFYSVMAVDSLANVLPKWCRWSTSAQNHPVLTRASYPFPKGVPKLIGVVIQNYRPRSGAPAESFQKWIDKIDETISLNLAPRLDEAGMLLPRETYEAAGIPSSFRLATIPDFNSLIAKSQEHQTPVFALREDDLGGGFVARRSVESRDNFRRIFEEMANRVVGVTQGATGN